MSARGVVVPLILASLLSGALACGRASEVGPGSAHAALDAVPDLAALVAPATAATLAKILATAPPQTLHGDALWALAQIGGTPASTRAWMAASAPRTGALPQVLMPDVRMALRQDSTVQSLQKSVLGQILSQVVLRADQVGTQVRGGVWQRITKALGLPAASPVAVFDLDGFQYTKDGADGAAGAAFDVEAETAAWQLVLSAPELWSLPAGSAGTYGDLQAVHLLRLFSEWQYAFGLKASPADDAFGGLSLAAAGGAALAPFDPRVAGAAPRLLAGRYQISYPPLDPLTLALSGKETWTWVPAPVALKEQAQLWLAAATALSRARPRNRPAQTGLFGAAGLLPDDAYLVTLAFLPGMNALLNGPFVDKAAESVLAAARLPAGAAAPADAGLPALARLIRALGRWHQELGETDDLQLDAGQKTQLAAGLPDLLDGLRLAVQRTVKHPDLGPGAQGGLADAAEALSAAAWAERELLQSPVLREAVADLTRAFFAERLAPALASGALTPRDVLALARLTEELKASAVPGEVGAAADNLDAALQTALAGWGKS